MDWKQQFKVHDLSFRDTCIILLLLAFISFILIQTDFGQVNPEAVSKAYRTKCASQQQAIYGIMRDLPDGEDFELPPEWTVADLIREAVGKDRRASSPIPGKEFFCRNAFTKAHFSSFTASAGLLPSRIWCFRCPPRSCSINRSSPSRSSCVRPVHMATNTARWSSTPTEPSKN